MIPKRQPSELRLAVEGLRPYLARASWFSLCSGLLVLMPTWYMLEVYDRVVNSRSITTLGMLTLLVLGAYVLMEVLGLARGKLLHEAGIVLDQQMDSRVFTAAFDANLRRLSGGTVQPINDLRTVREFLSSPILQAIMEMPVALVALVLIFAISPILGAAAVLGALIQVFLGWLNERGTQPPLTLANRHAIAAQHYVDATLRNAQVIESMGMVRDIHGRWMKSQGQFLDLQTKGSESAGSYQAVSRMLQNIVSSLLLGMSAWLLLNNKLNGGGAMLIVSGILGARVLAPLVQVVTQWRSVVNVRDAWLRLEHLLGTVPARSRTMPLPAPKGAVQVENLVAGAPNNPTPILRNIAFALVPGDVLMVIGPSASGKTTLARLLVGIWPAAGGKVRLDGVDVFGWDKAELGPAIGYLPQRVELFDGTLAENIARFGDIDSEKVVAAAGLVGLYEEIERLPMGYDSPIGADGAMLSGGMRQRVGLARALYGDPVFVVLDEPNSSLDEAGDAALTGAIEHLKAKGTTFVAMTHRTSLVAVTDKILILRDGQMQAYGPRDQVIAAINKANAEAQAAAHAASAQTVAGPVVPRQNAAPGGGQHD